MCYLRTEAFQVQHLMTKPTLMTLSHSVFSKAKCYLSNSHLNSCWLKKQCFSTCPVFSTAWLQYFWKEATSATNWMLNWTGSKSCSHSRSQNSLVFTCLVIGSLLFNSSIINSVFSTLKNNSSSKVNESSKTPSVPSSCHVWAPVLSLWPVCPPSLGGMVFWPKDITRSPQNSTNPEMCIMHCCDASIYRKENNE